VGSNPKASGAFVRALITPENTSVEFACFKQSNVFADSARDAQEGTPETKFCQSTSRRAAVNSNAVAAEPDSNIF
jgi:hypothetical protein